MNIIHETPVLSDKTSTGKRKYWQGFVGEENGKYFTYTEFWQDGSARQQSAPTEVVGKNIGRANETSPKDQAIFDIGSDWRKKEKKGYVPEGQTSKRELPLPMLALSEVYPKRARALTWPLLGQPKLDGIRMLTDSKRAWSREGNEFDQDCVGHLMDLELAKSGVIFDGEIMLPPPYKFQDVASALKNPKNPLHARLQFCVFDIFDTNAIFADRIAALEKFFQEYATRNKAWQLVTTVELADHTAAVEFLRKSLDIGFEGIILRNKRGLYKAKHRSEDLQKFKPEDDSEFEIIGYKEAEGKDAGTPVWRCRCGPKHPAFDDSQPAPGAEFDARPVGSTPFRRQLWKDRDKLIGSKVTVTYQGFMKSGVPRFPRAKAIRDYE